MDVILVILGAILFIVGMVAIFSSEDMQNAALGGGLFVAFSFIFLMSPFVYYKSISHKTYTILQNNNQIVEKSKQRDVNTNEIVTTSIVVYGCDVTIKDEVPYTSFGSRSETFYVSEGCNELSETTKERMQVILEAYRGH